MAASWQPTPYAGVNAHVGAALAELLAQVQSVLGAQLVGMYLTGSLALGDFDPNTSDIDFVVVTNHPLDAAHIAALEVMHMRFAASGTPWAGKIEANYVDRAALSNSAPQAAHSNAAHYPQVEKDRGFFVDRLEDGWLVQCYTLREHGVTLVGPDPRTLLNPIAPDALRRTVAPIAEMWRNEAHNDPTWLAWLRVRHNQAFVTLTLCRLLYTLEMGKVASKPAAARWAQTTLGAAWSALIEHALAGQQDQGVTPELDVRATVALIELVVARFRERKVAAAS